MQTRPEKGAGTRGERETLRRKKGGTDSSARDRAVSTGSSVFRPVLYLADQPFFRCLWLGLVLLM